MHQTFEPLFLDYCTYFNGNADYFECHEVLEELWKEVASGQKEHVLVGLIQIATSMYHWRRGNFRGAEKSLCSAMQIVENNRTAKYFEFVDVEQLLQNVHNRFQQIKAGEHFKGFQLNFTNEAFSEEIAKRIDELPELDEHFIIHKHTLRDRSDVIALRAERLAQKTALKNE